jgi:Uma2 family endonuclease
MTIEEFEAFVNLPENRDRRFEFIDGEIIEVPSNPYSSGLASQFIIALGVFNKGKNLGYITGEQGGYMVAGARLAPDVAYIRKSRQPELPQQGYNPLAPDLAIEIISPNDDDDDIEKKVNLYVKAGVLLWVVYPKRREVAVFAPGRKKQVIGIDGELDGGDVLPGFRLPLSEVFDLT